MDLETEFLKGSVISPVTQQVERLGFTLINLTLVSVFLITVVSNPPKQAMSNKQFQEIKTLFHFHNCPVSHLWKYPFRYPLGPGAIQHLEIKKMEPHRKLGRIQKEKNMGIWSYSMPWFWFFWKKTISHSIIWFYEEHFFFFKKTNFHFYNPCYLVSLTITNTSLRTHESQTTSFFSFPFPNQTKLVRSWPSGSLLSTLLTQLYWSYLLNLSLSCDFFIHVTLHCNHLFIRMPCPPIPTTVYTAWW